MTYWCIHVRRVSDDALIKIQMHGPDNPVHMAVVAINALKSKGMQDDFDIIAIHEQQVDVLDLFDIETGTAVGNMLVNGLALVGVIQFLMHYIQTHQKED